MVGWISIEMRMGIIMNEHPFIPLSPLARLPTCMSSIEDDSDVLLDLIIIIIVGGIDEKRPLKTL